MNNGETGGTAMALFISPSDRKIRLAALVLTGVALVGAAAWVRQLILGLGQTGMNNAVTWGIYIINFVFFIGISHAGALISAVLRLGHAEWRRPITRAAEGITVFALLIAGMQIVFDLGRPGLLFNVVLSGRLGSPMLWDVICFCVYLLSAVFCLLLPLLPDLADLRAHPGISHRRRAVYRFLSRGWEGTPAQMGRLRQAIGLMAILIIPIAVAVHSVVSWIFGMTLRPMWHSTILGPYFVTGAVFSGIAVVILLMAFLRRSFALESIVKPIHFRHMGNLLLLLCAMWFYFTLAEHLTAGYGSVSDESAVFRAKIGGEFKYGFWAMVVCMTATFVLLLLRRFGTIRFTVAASVVAIAGVWIERFLIVVPTLSKPLAEGYKPGPYVPTATEWLITAGSLAAFLALLLTFARKFPILSTWELREGAEADAQAAKRLRSYLPEGVNLREQSGRAAPEVTS